MKKVLLTTAMLALAGNAFADKLTITVNNILESKGTIQIAVIESGYEAKFPDEGRIMLPQPDGSMAPGVMVDATVPSVTTEVDVPAGTYAIAVYHDVNNDGKLNLVPFVKLPLEPYGFSNDARGQFGAPSFASASFEVDGDTAVEMDVIK